MGKQFINGFQRNAEAGMEQLPEQEKVEFCPVCGERLTADYMGNLSCPRLFHREYAKKRLKQAMKNTRLVIKEATARKGVIGFLWA